MASHLFATHRLPAALLVIVGALTLPPLRAEGPRAGAAPEQRSVPVRIESKAFGETAAVEIPATDVKQAAPAARAALDRIVELDQQLARAVEQANDTASAPPSAEARTAGAPAEGEHEVVVDRSTADLLTRARKFCEWSGGAHGPLGGALEDHWRAVGANPEPPPVPTGVTETAACNRLAVDPEAKGPEVRVRIANGSRLDLDGFAKGFAVDQAIDLLRQRGVDNALVRIGRIQRAIGDGPGGTERKGWPVLLPVFEGYSRPLEKLTLHDQAVAVEWRADWPADHPLFVNQRSGEPPKMVWATVVVSELAVDAQALGVSALVLGSREGRFRIAGLRPVPSVLWLQGSGQGRPLIMELNWTALHKP